MNWRTSHTFDGRNIVTLTVGGREFGHYERQLFGIPEETFFVPATRGARCERFGTEEAARLCVLRRATRREEFLQALAWNSESSTRHSVLSAPGQVGFVSHREGAWVE